MLSFHSPNITTKHKPMMLETIHLVVGYVGIGARCLAYSEVKAGLTKIENLALEIKSDDTE